MNPTVVRTLLEELPPPKAPANPAFLDLSDATTAKLRGVVSKIQALGLPMEVHPHIPDTFSFAFEGALYSVSVVQPNEEIVVTVQGRIGALSVDDLMNLLPDPAPVEASRPALRLAPLPPERRHHVDVLEEILAVQKEILAELRREHQG